MTSAGVARTAARATGLLVVAAFLALLAYGVLARGPSTTIDDALDAGRPVLAPPIALPVLLEPSGAPPARAMAGAVRDGRLALGELRGRPVVLNLWASWCTPCRDESPALQAAWRAQGPDGAAIVGLNQQDVREDALRFARELGITYLNLRDRGNETARRLGATGLPETYFISPDGRIVGHVIGVVSPAQLTAGIAAAKAGRPLRARQGGERRSR